MYVTTNKKVTLSVYDTHTQNPLHIVGLEAFLNDFTDLDGPDENVVFKYIMTDNGLLVLYTSSFFADEIIKVLENRFELRNVTEVKLS